MICICPSGGSQSLDFLYRADTARIAITARRVDSSFHDAQRELMYADANVIVPTSHSLTDDSSAPLGSEGDAVRELLPGKCREVDNQLHIPIPHSPVFCQKRFLGIEIESYDVHRDYRWLRRSLYLLNMFASLSRFVWRLLCRSRYFHPCHLP